MGEHATRIQGLYSYLVDEKANTWSQLDYVRDVAVMGSGGATGTIGSLHHNEWMSVNPTKKSTIGPELGIGFAMGLNGTKAPTMLLKSCIGNRALGWDLLPPGTKEWDYDMATARCRLLLAMGSRPRSGTRDPKNLIQSIGMQASSMTGTSTVQNWFF